MKIFRTILSLFLIFCIFFTLFYGVKRIGEEDKIEETEKYKGIITVWQIDTFEGGIGSRKQFLLSMARKFEKENKGVYVMVVDKTEEGFLSSEEVPDIISYGNGICVKDVVEIKSDKTFNAGKINGIQYAIPWCRGGYYVITNPNYKKNKKTSVETVVSVSNYTNPFASCLFTNEELGGYVEKKPLDAYIEFVSGSVKKMIGTQRDIIRLENRGFEYVCSPLNGYNDIYQYFSLTKNGLNKGFAEKFINFIISEEVQKELKKIGMCSPYYSVEFGNENLNKLQNTEFDRVLNAFISTEKIVEFKDLAKQGLGGDKNSVLKLKNMLI